MTPVRLLGAEDQDQVIAVLAEAFHDYPVMRYVLGGEPGYDRRLSRMVSLVVGARVLRGEPLLGMEGAGELAAAAAASYPENRESTPAVIAHRDAVWADLGPQVQERYMACVSAWKPLDVAAPNLHLNMIGVRRAYQGQGLGRRLLDHVQDMARARGVEGVSLTTENPDNVAIYERVGYRVVGHAVIAPGLETWGFFRPNG
jgi:ribosomal protein S18 acetylase RimI-like enzyme